MKKTFWILAAVLATAALIYFLSIVFSGRIILPAGFELGNFSVRFYGIILGLAVLAGYLVARANSWRYGLSQQETDKFAFWLIIVSLLCGRLYFVLFAISYYLKNPIEIPQIWHGGLSIYGAILGGIIFTYFFTRRKIYTVWQILDLVALSLPLGQAIGRFGNFFNYEAFGRPTNLPWRMFIPENFRPDPVQAFYHPTFLYESVANFLLFIVLLNLRGKVRSGNLALIYLLSYAAIRFFIEPLRIDSVFISGFRVDQIISLLVFFVVLVLLIRRRPITSPKV